MQDNTYDAANRVTKITHSGTGQTPLRVDQTYTDDNRTDTITRYSDLAGTTKVGSSNYDYDADGRLTDLQHLDGSDANIADYDFAYDPGNRLTSETLNTVTKNYQYDDTNQLTDDNGTSHSYDGTGNRTNTGYSTGTGNRITSDGTWTYSYDDEGNITKKSKGASDETWTYGYDHRNQMVWAEKRATDGGTLEMRSDYKYEAWGNRIEKEVDEDGDTNVDINQRYALDGWKPGGNFTGNENWDVWADLDDTNAVDTRYLRGDIIDQLFAQVDSTDTNWLLGDHIGTIRNITDGTGANKNTITYSAFGEITNQSDPNYSSRYTFASREYDAETEFLYNRARYYSPEIGRWTSEDPIGFDAGDSNLFRYVTNQPTTQTDPSGLDGIEHIQQYIRDGMDPPAAEALGWSSHLHYHIVTHPVGLKGWRDYDAAVAELKYIRSQAVEISSLYFRKQDKDIRTFFLNELGWESKRHIDDIRTSLKAYRDSRTGIVQVPTSNPSTGPAQVAQPTGKLSVYDDTVRVLKQYERYQQEIVIKGQAYSLAGAMLLMIQPSPRSATSAGDKVIMNGAKSLLQKALGKTVTQQRAKLLQGLTPAEQQALRVTWARQAQSLARNRVIPRTVSGLTNARVAHFNRTGYQNYRLETNVGTAARPNWRVYYHGRAGPRVSQAQIIARHARTIGPDGRARFNHATDRIVMERGTRLYGEARLMEHRNIIRDQTNIGRVDISGSRRGNNIGGMDPAKLREYEAWERALNSLQP